MGLPEGWVTDVGLKRNEELKACGNGVVPQQAAYALRILLGGNTNAFESLATLPTTRAQNGENRNNKIWARDLSKPQNLENALAITVPGLVDETATGGGLLPTPTVGDQRDGKHLRNVAVENLRNGKNRGVGLNHLTETIGVDWADGDTFDVVDGKVVKNAKP